MTDALVTDPALQLSAEARDLLVKACAAGGYTVLRLPGAPFALIGAGMATSEAAMNGRSWRGYVITATARGKAFAETLRRVG